MGRNKMIGIICCVILIIIILICFIKFNNKKQIVESTSNIEGETVYEVYNEENGLYELHYTNTNEIIDYYETKEDVESMKNFYDENPGYMAEPPISPIQ